MESKQPEVLNYLGVSAIVLFLGFSFFAVLDGVFVFSNEVFGAASSTVTASTTVVVGNAAPTVNSVTLNNGSAITLTPNATTTIYVSAQIADNNGCTDLQNGTTTILVYRSGYTSSTCLTTSSNLSCYRVTTFSASSTCTGGGTSVDTTSSVDIYYFADSTENAGTATSTYPAQNWLATVIFKDPSNATGSRDSSGVEVNVLLAINITTSSINYDTMSASSTSGSTNQVTTSTNAGNSTSSLQIRANSTLTSGSNSIPTSSQKYATSSFNYDTSTTTVAITDTTTPITGTTMVTPTSTTNVSKTVFWGLTIPAGTATGTYSGVNLFTARYVDVAN